MGGIVRVKRNVVVHAAVVNSMLVAIHCAASDVACQNYSLWKDVYAYNNSDRIAELRILISRALSGA